MNYQLRGGQTQDQHELLGLYRAVSQQNGGIIRNVHEITPAYIQQFLSRSLENGISLIAETADGQVVGDIHAYTSNLQAFRHILGELTIVVHPDWQGKGIGSNLFRQFLAIVTTEKPDIQRVELLVREINRKAISFYQQMGFSIEGRMKNRILNDNGAYETPVMMAWLR